MTLRSGGVQNNLKRIIGFMVWGSLACWCAGTAYATNIPATFVGGEIPTGPDSTVTLPANLPALLGGNSDNEIFNYAGDLLFLKFKIADLSDIEGIDSFVVSVYVFDNGDGGGESAEIDFALPGGNLVLAPTAFTSLNGTTEQSERPLTYTLTPDEIAEVIPTILDGNFRLRVMRETGDFEVEGASAIIDAVVASTPEPSSFLLMAGLLMAGALSGLAVPFRRRLAGRLK